MPAGENMVKIDPALMGRLRTGRVVLTGSQRAARSLLEAFDQACVQDGRTQWDRANVLAVDTWFGTLWHELQLNGDEARLLLNRAQEHVLWRRILAADPEAPGLRSADQLADMAVEAWSTLCLHDGRGRLREFGVSTDAKAFQRWAQEFERRCRRGALLPEAQLAEALGEALAAETLPLPNDGLTLVDIEDLPPAAANLLEQIERAGYTVERLSTGKPSLASLHMAPDDEAEAHAAAVWCRERLAGDPSARSAVVVPNLADRRFALARTFAELLAPQSRPITAAPTPPLFEFSLGVPLAQTPACAVALDLLRWALNPLPLNAISGLLLSPFLAGEQAADFDAHTLRRVKLLRPELSLEAFLDLASDSRQACPLPAALGTSLRAMRRAAAAEQAATAERPHDEWAEAFRAVLEASGWSAATDCDALARQARQRLDSLLDELATLASEPTRVSAAEALRELGRLAQQTVFAPASSHAPIQILGPLELGGVAFDHLWLLGADDLNWPPAAATGPLIPWTIAQSLRTPGADRAHDRRRARVLTDRILAGAAEVMVSYAERSDEGARRPSPLVAGLPPAAAIALPQPQAPVELLEHLDTQPIAALPGEVVEGGAAILRAQAACAFRAFAERRLRSAAPETSEAGLNPRDRGTLVHDVMEHFWSSLRDQPTLRALTAAERLAALDEAITAALTRTAARARVPWERAYVEVQRRRLRRLLEPWVEVELNRPAFAVREHEREAHGLTIGPLRLTVRIDRVDETAAGPLILDYKTGDAKPSEWLSERPDEPQIPLYAVLADPPPAGVAFALLRAGDGLKLVGFADEDDVFGKRSRMALSMADQVEDWHRILTRLAEDFAAGEASVAPKCYPKTCQYCDQRILCRLDPAALDDAGDDDAELSYG